MCGAGVEFDNATWAVGSGGNLTGGRLVGLKSRPAFALRSVHHGGTEGTENSHGEQQKSCCCHHVPPCPPCLRGENPANPAPVLAAISPHGVRPRRPWATRSSHPGAGSSGG